MLWEWPLQKLTWLHASTRMASQLSTITRRFSDTEWSFSYSYPLSEPFKLASCWPVVLFVYSLELEMSGYCFPHCRTEPDEPPESQTDPDDIDLLGLEEIPFYLYPTQTFLCL